MLTVDEEFIASAACSCPKVAAQLAALPDSELQSPNLAGGLVFLLVTQDGGGTAEDVTLKVNAASAGELSYYDLADMKSIAANPPGEPSEIRLGTMTSGSKSAIALFHSVEVTFADKFGERDGTALAISPTFIPLSLQYRDRSMGTVQEADVREPSQTPVGLGVNLTARG